MNPKCATQHSTVELAIFHFFSVYPKGRDIDEIRQVIVP
jgi:hypothetical protein